METPDWKAGEWEHINFPAIKIISGEKKPVTDLPPADPRYIPSGKLSTVAPGKRYYKEDAEIPIRRII